MYIRRKEEGRKSCILKGMKKEGRGKEEMYIRGKEELYIRRN
jgi:hypothetical protein